MPQHISVEVADGVATVTFDKPERRNAWDPVMEREYFAELDRLDRDDEVRAIVVTGAGSTFCPGVDAQRLESAVGTGMNLSGRVSPTTAAGYRKPIVAAINGACAGMGLVQALMCDVRFAARGARFTTAFSRRGLAGEYGITWVLPRLVGIENALDLLLSGRVIEADEARELGLVSRVVEPDDLLDAAQTYAADLARHCSPASMALIKNQVWSGLDTGFDEALAGTYRAMAYAAGGRDFGEGVASFLERRDPEFAPLDPHLAPEEITGRRVAQAGDLLS
ncbi:enoyl-CoA hydratase-related protein [Nocardioides sp. NPDC057767]|uniref:enoyl-CoA hydratase-related protein n=1 Tax=unclassified Nocardioides TaxID=2615069 RepID=UPI00331AEE1D